MSATTTSTGRDHKLEAGFTLVELMVASLVLIVGMLGVLVMLTGALRTTTVSNERVAATNLGRELVEAARGLNYEDLNLVRTRLQARGLGAGTPWTIERRGVTYSVTSTTCAFDDPSDKYAATPPANACTGNPVGSDANGDDFRRVTFKLGWQTNDTARSMEQTTLIVNPSGGLGPRITDFYPVTRTFTTNVNPSITWETTTAQSLHWEADDGVSSGDVSGSTSFTTNWNIGISGSGTEVLDGTYTISGQAFDDRGIAGEAKRADVVLNRRRPYAPAAFTGGHDTRLGDWVDFDWNLNTERDIEGYRIVWTGPDGALGTVDDQQVCPAPAVGSMLPRTTKSCADPSPQPGRQTYYVVAIDREPPPSGALRDGDVRLLTVGAAGARPDAPTALSVTTVAGAPKLDWSAPAAGGAAFYRIYRGGSAFADRHDRTTGAATTFTDSAAGATSRQYWVTAVGADYNESDPLGPVTWTP